MQYLSLSELLVPGLNAYVPRLHIILALIILQCIHCAYPWELWKFEEKMLLVAVVSLSCSDKLRFSGRWRGPQPLISGRVDRGFYRKLAFCTADEKGVVGMA